VCHACAVVVRSEARRGLREIEEYLATWGELERWLSEQE
jgi:hypothetical protein